jgi:DNA-binding GntR family transcriptional regulator
MAERVQSDRNGAERLSSPSLGEAVYRSLRQNLRSGLYRPGDRLREEEIAKRLNVSRTPVREALGRLTAKGLLEPAAGRGLIVRSLSTAEVLELYAMREILEGSAARLAAQQASPAEIQALADLEGMFEAQIHDLHKIAQINRTFHDAIFQAARNRYLNGALQELQDAIALLGPTTFSVNGRASLAVEEHREIVKAIAQRDPERAEALARAHIQQALRSRLALLHSA